MNHFDQFVAAVKEQMRPEPRANATAATLQQLSAYIPDNVTLADLAAAWGMLAHPQGGEEPGNVKGRRATCGELASIAAQFTNSEEGEIARAAQAWHVWRNAFAASGDARQNAMAETFARELRELEA